MSAAGVYSPVFKRLGNKVDFEAPNGCWEWLGALNAGYGVVADVGPKPRRTLKVHRAMFENVVGPIPEGLQLDHLCKNTKCCNPEHLEPVTPRENTMRSDGFSRHFAEKTHCPRGHEYAGDNLYIQPRGGRACRTCARDSERVRQAAKRAKAASA